MDVSYRRYYKIQLLGFSVLLMAGVILYEALETSDYSASMWKSAPRGGLFPVVCNVVFTTLFAYTQTMVYLTVKQDTRTEDATYQQAAYGRWIDRFDVL